MKVGQRVRIRDPILNKLGYYIGTVTLSDEREHLYFVDVPVPSKNGKMNHAHMTFLQDEIEPIEE